MDENQFQKFITVTISWTEMRAIDEICYIIQRNKQLQWQEVKKDIEVRTQSLSSDAVRIFN